MYGLRLQPAQQACLLVFILQTLFGHISAPSKSDAQRLSTTNFAVDLEQNSKFYSH